MHPQIDACNHSAQTLCRQPEDLNILRFHVTEWCRTVLGIEHDMWHSRDPAKAAQNPQIRSRVPITAHAAQVAQAALCSLGTLDRFRQPVPVSSSKLVLVLDGLGAGVESTVTQVVIQTHIGSGNACNVKIGTYPVHLGVDPAST